MVYPGLGPDNTKRNERRPGSSPEDHKISAMPTCEEKGKTKEKMRKEGEEGEGREKKEGAGGEG